MFLVGSAVTGIAPFVRSSKVKQTEKGISKESSGTFDSLRLVRAADVDVNI